MEKNETYETILARKIEYYGETKAAYQFSAEEYASQYKQKDIVFPTKDELLSFSKEWASIFKYPERFTAENAHYAGSVRMLDLFVKTLSNKNE